jgi:LysR family transcriptional regulator, glycine cleavage system transcriptional activator
MKRLLPSLTALRAFDAAGRCLSFTDAARELNVTQAAISQQVRALEEYLDTRLFERRAQGIVPTLSGEILIASLSESLDRIEETLERVRRKHDVTALTIRLPPYLSAKWLMPRLGRFVEQHPQIHLRLHHQVEAVDFSREKLDLAVHWSFGNWAGAVVEPLIVRSRIPMCSPALLQAKGRCSCAADLSRFNLLHEFDFSDWQQWFALAGLPELEARRGTVIDNYDVLVEAAVDGQGMALLLSPPFVDYAATGALIAPLGDITTVQFVYYLMAPPEALQRPQVAAFREFLLTEASNEATLAATLRTNGRVGTDVV